jgi:cyclic pyranopterin monophosphate synthase
MPYLFRKVKISRRNFIFPKSKSIFPKETYIFNILMERKVIKVEFTHFNEQRRAKMVDISEKEHTIRTAIAKSSVRMNRQVYEHIVFNKIKKGDVLGVAQIAGITGAKQTSSIIPMCHPISLTAVDLHFEWYIYNANMYELVITSKVKTRGATGVEMEALTGALAAALSVYDMCKSLDKSMEIGPTYLLQKTGGISGNYEREEVNPFLAD